MITQEETIAGESDIARPVDGDCGRRARVLLVEDDRSLRRYLEVTIARAGYDVTPAADGLQAMKALLNSPMDIVITDAMMPNLNGHELCRFLKNSPQLAHIPVILLSALERKETNPEAEPADAFLAKPVSAVDLIECLRELLSANKT
jgi:two-component system cell cycle response regulator